MYVFVLLQGKIASDKNLRGIFIQSVDRDDIKLTCQVGSSPMPVVKCITDGAAGLPEPTDLTSNANWALLPADRPQ